MSAKELLDRFRHDMGLTELEYRNFCKRYANRDISTVIWYFSQLYGELSSRTCGKIKNELRNYR